MKNERAPEATGADDDASVVYEFAGFRLDPARRSLSRPDGSALHLVGKPFDTLVYLVAHAGRPVDRHELLRAVWPRRVVEDNNLNQAVATVRRTVGEQHVATIAGHGYQFVTAVQRIPAAVGDDSPTRPAAIIPVHEPARASWGPPPTTAARSAWPLVAGAGAAVVAIVALLAFPPWSEPPLDDSRLSLSVKPLTTYVGQELTPAFAPEGTRVAFSWQPPKGRRSIYVTQTGGGDPMQLTEGADGEDLYPAWSPDGERIAFLRFYDPKRADVMIVPALGGAPSKVYTTELWPISVEGHPLLAWSPDGRQLLFPTLRAGEEPGASYGLHRLDLFSGEIADLGLKNETMHYDTSPAIAPDGTKLAFTRFDRSQRLNDVLVQRLGPGLTLLGLPELVTPLEPNVYHSLHWSASSDRLWFSDNSRIVEWSAADGVPVVVHTVGPRFSLRMMAVVQRAQDARAAVVVRQSGEEIFAVPLDPVSHAATGRAEARVPAPAASDYHPRVSPDGEWLAFISDRSGSREVWVAHRDGSKPRKLTDMGQLIVGYPRWSPDGKTIAFHSLAPGAERTIYSVDVDSGLVRRLFQGCCPGSWSADGRSLYVTELGPVNYVQRVDVANGSRQRLFEGETAVESADGRYLLYSRSREPGYFRRTLDPAGHSYEERLVEDYQPTRGGLAVVADGFFYIGLTPNGVPRAIRFYDYALGAARDIAEVPESTSIGLSISPDGREIFYAAIDDPPEADIMLLELTESSAR